MNARGMRTAYYGQWKLAEKRGIAWHFTYESWQAWWYNQLGPDWYSMRGSIDGQYVMARKGDKGPYAEWNVECKTCQQNHMDQAANRSSNWGEKNGCAKLKEAQVIEIFNSREPPKVLAKRYNVTSSAVTSILRGKSWRYLGLVKEGDAV